ncbi:hypothetical protein OKE80_04150 [Riemerella anatipestifer]|uniref:hypothetical protein n=1 Tax=Riemerella anatipestifer TaxID=34085 RepID=UPI0012AE366C|nr:hypothetical protein [Riemerella anatipestifer]MCO7318534.1 hypothetical protein [Riemerella anatipestifer]MCQ4154896.1 hypothetical protein [Riemerella anatipestifer]MCQ4180821.1 hypothetical protein [Riemerella anatipestifer]MCW0474014.1 hypothetical protein [Riemerella anatipestifer]MDY3346637.1 hypothetical protein [Riemerella anatipestifer]
MPNFDIDKMKEVWKEQPKPTYDNQQIEQMLNRKSRNYVKTIFWISVAEFLIILAFNIYGFCSVKREPALLNVFNKMNIKIGTHLIENYHNIELFIKGASLILTLLFVLLFYYSYQTISIESNLKKFITQIIKFRRIVNAFILANLAMFLVIMLGYLVEIIYLAYVQNVSFSEPKFLVFLVSYIVSIFLGVGFIWLYYRLIYGIIIKRLNEKLKQLQNLS